MAKPKNVVLLSVDALRADHLSCYGYRRDTSPVIDGLADEAVQFTDAFSASSHTREAVPALLSGTYPDEAVDSRYKLATDTIATLLRGQGFGTGAFHSNPYLSRAYGFDAGFDVFDDDLNFGTNRLFALAQRLLDKIRNRHYARAETINERALSWLDSLDGDEPFFLWNHYMDPHGPYYPPDEYQQEFTDQQLTKGRAQELYRTSIESPDAISQADQQLQLDLYDGEIRYLDDQIGRFIRTCKRYNLYEDSLIIVLGDHGEEFGEHGIYCNHWSVYEGTQHIPLIVKPPRDTAVRQDVRHELVTNVDIAPTLADHFNTRMPARWQGSSLLPLINNRSGEWRDSVVLEHGLWTAQRAIRRDDWKLVRTLHPGVWEETLSDIELYQLKDDPWEQEDVSEIHTDIVTELSEELNEWVDDHVGSDGDPLSTVAKEGPMGYHTIRNDWETTVYL